jgi:5'-3' exoribonuclease 1
VLPAASAKHVPEAYRHLMLSPASPIIDFYPKTFETDLNGKKNEWEAVVKIMFVDEARLLAAMAPCEKSLSFEVTLTLTDGCLGRKGCPLCRVDAHS